MLTLIKLNNGTEVLGTVDSDNDKSLTIRNPMQINYRLTSAQPTPVISVSRYMPFSEVNVFTFNKVSILHETKPRRSMEEYYYHALQTHSETIDNSIDRELLNAVGFQNEDDLSQAYKDLLEHLHYGGLAN
jgi:hypothetical protein